PLRVSFVRAVDRWLIQRNSSTGKKSLYNAAARRDKKLRELYAGGRSFSTSGGTDRMRGEGRHMKIRACLFLLVLAAAATALAAPQTSKTVAPRDPKIIDAQGYQKLLEQNRGKPMRVNIWATYCEPLRDEERILTGLAKKCAPAR